MRVLVEGSGGAAGWPQPGCRCASCLRLGGKTRERSTIMVDGMVRRGAGDVAIPEAEGYRILGVPGGWEVTAPDGGRLLYGAVPAEGTAPYDIALLDLIGEPARLGLLRARGLITSDTVTAV